MQEWESQVEALPGAHANDAAKETNAMVTEGCVNSSWHRLNTFFVANSMGFY